MVAVLSILLIGCSETTSEPVSSARKGSLTVRLSVPGNSKSQTARDASMSVYGSETTINSLQLIGYRTDGSLSFYRELESPTSNGGPVIYTISDIDKGDYRIYIVANLTEEVKENTVSTEEALKAIMMDFSSRLPEAGNLPMVAEPDATVSINGNSSTEIECTLTIAAVKMRYSIVFDSEVTGADFNGKGLKIREISIDGIASSAFVVKRKVPPIQLRKLGHEDVFFQYFNVGDSDYYNEANKDKSDSYIVDLSGLEGQSAPSSYNGKWVANGLIYLPERYIIDESAPVSIQIKGDIINADNTSVSGQVEYILNIQGESLPRGTFYEIVGKVKTLGEQEDNGLDVVISVAEWTDELIDLELGNGGGAGSTHLEIGRSSVTVSSGLPADIVYTANTSEVSFECDEQYKVGDQSLLRGETVFDNQGRRVMRVMVNDNIPIEDIETGMLSNAGGTPASCRIVAGSIKKEIKVTYTVIPYVSLSPVALALSTVNEERGIKVSSNLTGIRIYESDATGKYGSDITETTESDGYSDSQQLINIVGELSSRPMGLTLKLLKAPDASTDFYFLVTGVSRSDASVHEALLHVIAASD